jgi:hypothetical protein
MCPVSCFFRSCVMVNVHVSCIIHTMSYVPGHVICVICRCHVHRCHALCDMCHASAIVMCYFMCQSCVMIMCYKCHMLYALYVTYHKCHVYTGHVPYVGGHKFMSCVMCRSVMCHVPLSCVIVLYAILCVIFHVIAQQASFMVLDVTFMSYRS